MKWYDSEKFKPEDNTRIFVWDHRKQKQTLIYYFTSADDWLIKFDFPAWAYAFDGHEPIKMEKPE